jgi:hypothetical protein
MEFVVHPHSVRASVLAALALVTSTAGAQAAADWSALERSRTNAPRPTAAAITVDDLRSRLFAYADDSMRGRVLGDRGNVKATAYIAAEARRLGLEPAGDSGGYLQRVPVVQRTFDETTRLRIGDRVLEAWMDYLMRDNGPGQRSIDGVPAVFGGVWGDQQKMISRDAAAGKVVVVVPRQGEAGSGLPGLPNRQQVAAYFEKAAGILVVAMSAIPPEAIGVYRQPSIGMRSEGPAAPTASYFYISADVARAVLGADPAALAPGATGRSLTGNPTFVERPVDQPAYNVVGIVRGSDPALRGEYVAIGAHNDHVGVDPEPVPHDSMYVFNHLFRPQGADDDPNPRLAPADVERMNAALAAVRRRTNGVSARADSVYNGADDDASGTVSVLEMAEYFASLRANERPKRSLVFVWHVGEEAGLFGSEWFTDHPTVPRDAIVTQLNMDMVGRGDATDVTGVTKDGKPIHGGDGYVQLIGSRRLSTELGDLIEQVNLSKNHGMTLDYALDADGHPQNIYCRSDHYSYARYGIPVSFFTTGGHADYHQLTDEPQYINYPHMLRVVNFVRDIAAAVGNLPARPNVDKPKPDLRAPCQQ